MNFFARGAARLRIQIQVLAATTVLVIPLLLAGRLAAAEVDITKLPPAATAPVDFTREIKPLFENSCLKCHGPEKPKGGFRLDTREHALKGGEDGVSIAPGESAKSPLIHFVARLVQDSEMPPKGKGEPLTKEQIGLLRAWIDAGAKWADGVVLVAAVEKLPIEKLPPAATRPVDFVQDIQPIFADNCYGCHGPKKQEANFRLDHKLTALRGGDLGPAIVPGKSVESLLIHLVAGLKPDQVMPQKGDRLTSEKIALLRAWIDQGANWPESASVQVVDKRAHWAFKAPVQPPLPAIKDQKWVRQPVDTFVRARLEKENLQPSPETDKTTLLRRVSLDLIGLPPTVEEVDAFLADTSSGAYEKQVDRLLRSPHYGERWGRLWLDAARYADSDGYEKDMSREAWPYRDYVVNAFNRDLPYNQFLIEQLAGDELPNATQDQIVATGFLRNSMVNMEGAIDPEQFRMDAMFDRMDAIGKSILGLTIQCAQCHNHKYDPITQEDYYRLFAFINNDHEARPVVYTPEQRIKVTQVRQRIGEIEMGLRERAPDWEKQMSAWEESVRNDQPAWIVLTNLEQEGEKDQRYELKKDGSLLAGGYAPTKFTQHFRTTNDLTEITAFRLELLTDPNLPYGGPGRAFNGTCALSDFSVEAVDRTAPTNKVKVKWAKAFLE